MRLVALRDGAEWSDSGVMIWMQPVGERQETKMTPKSLWMVLTSLKWEGSGRSRFGVGERVRYGFAMLRLRCECISQSDMCI